MYNSNQLLINELQVYRHAQGLKFVKPKSKENKVVKHQPFTLAALLQLPVSVFLLDSQSRLQNANRLNLNMLQADSLKEVYGRTGFEIFPCDICKKILIHDQMVIMSEKKRFFAEEVPLKDGSMQQRIVLKFPWYDENNKIKGVGGFCMEVTPENLVPALSSITGLGILDNDSLLTYYLPGLQVDGVKLSRREIEILKHLVRGKTARLVAAAFCISERTVQTHLENIKNKMGVSTKSELIDKAFRYFCL